MSSSRPLSHKAGRRAVYQPLSPHRSNANRPAASKRARSPDPHELSNLPSVSKRIKGCSVSPDKESRRAAKEAQKEEFRVKYTKAFPNFNFYFDLGDQESELRNRLEAGVVQLGAQIDDFFSNEVTHFITPYPIPESIYDKENDPISKIQPPKPPAFSPTRSKVRLDEGMIWSAPDSLVRKAQSFGIKIWRTDKLESVLERLILSPLPSTAPPTQPRTSVTRLLQSERVHGSSERDPTQKRHDYHYFSKGSYFVLVEDIKSELATIAAHEYVLRKGKDGKVLPSWPILHCHPHARGPFVAFDLKEKRRWEKMQGLEKDSQTKPQDRVSSRPRCGAKAFPVLSATSGDRAVGRGDLRRSVSMGNLNRRIVHDQANDDADAVGETLESGNASGFLPSGLSNYVAASGNSVAITSALGSTSTPSASTRSSQLPLPLRARIQRQVVTSRGPPGSRDVSGTMGPPENVPAKPRLLRKSRSTNTVRLAKREEGSKPGYCESCRMRFDSFKQHTMSRKHRKFAEDDSNFIHLDQVLLEVRRQARGGI